MASPAAAAAAVAGGITQSAAAATAVVKTHLAAYFQHVRFPLINAQSLDTVVEASNLVDPALLYEAYRFHSTGRVVEGSVRFRKRGSSGGATHVGSHVGQQHALATPQPVIASTMAASMGAAAYSPYSSPTPFSPGDAGLAAGSTPTMPWQTPLSQYPQNVSQGSPPAAGRGGAAAVSPPLQRMPSPQAATATAAAGPAGIGAGGVHSPTPPYAPAAWQQQAAQTQRQSQQVAAAATATPPATAAVAQKKSAHSIVSSGNPALTAAKVQWLSMCDFIPATELVLAVNEALQLGGSGASGGGATFGQVRRRSGRYPAIIIIIRSSTTHTVLVTRVGSS